MRTDFQRLLICKNHSSSSSSRSIISTRNTAVFWGGALKLRAQNSNVRHAEAVQRYILIEINMLQV
jgi:hypothetical protein